MNGSGNSAGAASAGQRIEAKAQELLAMHVPGAGDMIIVGQERDE